MHKDTSLVKRCWRIDNTAFIHIQMCILVILLTGMRSDMVRPPVASDAVHVVNLHAGMVIRWGHPHPPT